MKKLMFALLLAFAAQASAQTSISGLPAADPPADADIVPIVQGGATKRTTVGAIRDGGFTTSGEVIDAWGGTCDATTYLRGDGNCAAPAGGGGEVSISGTPTTGQAAEWTNATTIQGVATTGSGSYVKATSPTLVTPALGTPSSVVLTNATGTAAGLTAGAASALAANPADCASDRYANAIAANGDLSCVQVTVAGLSATGTPSGSTFLRGDGVWAAPAGGGDVVMGTTSAGGSCYLDSGTTINCDAIYADMPASTAQGDVLYFSAANTLARLAKDTNATRYLSNTGTTNNPAWAQINLANGVTGDLPYANLTAASAASRLLGRGSAAGAGDWQEITIGSGLNMSGTELSATGGGFDATTVDAVTWSDGANASNVWTFDVSGTDTTLTFGNGTIAAGATFSATQFANNMEIGAASDTTLARASAGVLSVEGVTITRTIASGTAALGTSAITSGNCATVVTSTATGTATTDTITWTPNADISAVTGYAPVTTGALIIYPYPTTNNVNFKVCNPTSSSITPGAVTLNWKVLR